MRNNPKDRFVKETTEKIIESLKNGTAPWIKPCNGNDLRRSAPFNGVSGIRYRGINNINLGMTAIMNDYKDPRWFTYNQARNLGAQVKKGEKSSLVQHWIFTEQRDKLDENNNKIYKNAKPEQEAVKLDRPKVIYHNIFNAEQIDNIPKLENNIEKLSKLELNKTAEDILKASRVKIIYSDENRAYYNPHTDIIILPQKENFESEGSYYSTALHELGHWTGHESRLDRELANHFGSKGYAKEELRAEIGSYLLSSEIGIDYDPRQHMSYIDSWVDILEDKPSELFKATSDATKIVNFVKEIHLEQTQKENLEQILAGDSQEQKKIQSATVPTLKKENFKEFFSTVENSEVANSLIGGQTWGNWNDEENGAGYKIEQIMYNKLAWVLENPTNITEIENTLEDVKMYFVAIGKEFPIDATNEQLQDYFENVTDKYLEKEKKEIAKIANKSNEKTLLFVPYGEKDAAQRLGAKWDAFQKSWYAPTNTDLDPFNRWRNGPSIQNNIASNLMVIDSVDKIGDVFNKLGIDTPDDLVMDGSLKRVPINKNSEGKKDVAYIIYNDTSVSGWIKNWATGDHVNFIVNNGINYNQDQLNSVIAKNKELSEKREEERDLLQLKTAEKLETEYNNARWSYNQHPYFKSKGLDKNYYTKQDDRGNILIPLRDVDGKLWTTQRIFRNGDKTNDVIRTSEEKAAGIVYAAKKQGCFFTVGAKDISKADTIIITEGFATAASVFEASNIPTVAAVDAGNIEHVVKAIKEKYPKKEIIIAGDNDLSKELEGKPNVGKETALRVAKQYNLKVIIPILSSSEVSNKFSDFNDLANSRGYNEVKNQLSLVIPKARFNNQVQKQQQTRNAGRSY